MSLKHLHMNLLRILPEPQFIKAYQDAVGRACKESYFGNWDEALKDFREVAEERGIGLSSKPAIMWRDELVVATNAT